LEPEGNTIDVDSDGRLSWAAEDEDSNSFVYLSLHVDYGGDSLERSGYLDTLHARAAERRSLVLPFDAPTLKSLERPMSEVWLDGFDKDFRELLKRYCRQTANAIFQHDRDHLRSPRNAEPPLTAFQPGTMASLIEGSIFDAPDYAKVEKLLDQEAQKLTDALERSIVAWKAARHLEAPRNMGKIAGRRGLLPQAR
jgi:hypothetical protein